MPSSSDIESCFRSVAAILLEERDSNGVWKGELSTSALSTATAVMALHLARQSGVETPDSDRLIAGGLKWLADKQNPDGGWGDTVLSISNISTTMLANAVFVAVAGVGQYPDVVQRSKRYIADAGGVEALVRRYGKDKTFSVPILTHCALAGVVDWKQITHLPFELACVPPRFYAAVRMPVVSYALPALIAIGQLIHHKRGHWNPLLKVIRKAATQPALRVLERIQPENGGFLEATPLTSFVCMSLIGAGRHDHPVVQRGLDFIRKSVRDDGSWPIDTNLTTWVTTLSINAFAGSGPGAALAGNLTPADEDRLRAFLLNQQYRRVHPYTNSPPGGWSWTDLPGGVPDADDTPGAMLALLNLRPLGADFSAPEQESLAMAVNWLLGLQNRDGGWPTFCRGWGTLPFDRSSNDLTAHVLRAFSLWQQRIPGGGSNLDSKCVRAMDRGLAYLERTQRADGSWLPLWFGNQFNTNDENPLYGTAKVVLALKDIGRMSVPMAFRAVTWLKTNQNEDGGWSARKGIASTTEETALAVEALAGVANCEVNVQAGASWLCERVRSGRVQEPSPIGFYFAKLWYFERLYPIIYTVAALRRCVSSDNSDGAAADGDSP